MKRLLYILFMMIGFYSVGIGQITVNTNFTPNIAGHIDSRCVLTNLADTSTISFKYEGMLIYVAVPNKFYYYETYWKELASETLIDSYVSNNGYLTGVGTSNYLPVWGGATYLTYSSGTGFVKVTNGNISYDNSTYLTTEVDGSTSNEIQRIDTFEIYDTDKLRISLQNDGQPYKTITLPAGSDTQDLSLDSLSRVFTLTLTNGGTVKWKDTDTNSGGTVTAVTGTSPINSSGGNTPAISIDLLKDLVIQAPLTGGAYNNILPGSDSDVLIGADTTSAITGLVTKWQLSQLSFSDTQDLSLDSLNRVFTLNLTNGGSVKFKDTDTQLSESQVDSYVSNNGYLTGNQSITLTGDATGTGTTSITVGVVDNSHEHNTGTITDNIVSSVENVSNDGGNIDLVGSGIITITGNDGANTITIGATETDGSTSNEVQTLSADSTSTTIGITSSINNSRVHFNVLKSEVDGSITNELVDSFYLKQPNGQLRLKEGSNLYTINSIVYGGSALGANYLPIWAGGQYITSYSGDGLINVSGGIVSTVTNNSSNWNTAYGWGNHANAGYITSETGDISSVTVSSPLTGGGTSGAVSIGIQSDTLTSWRTKQNQGVIGYNDKINSAGFSGTTTKTLTLTQQDGGTVTAQFTDIDTDTQLSAEQVQDYIGAMVTGNTENNMNVDYQDSDGTLDFNITMEKDIVANAPLSGGANNVLIGNDSDVTISVDTTSTTGLATQDDIKSKLKGKNWVLFGDSFSDGITGEYGAVVKTLLSLGTVTTNAVSGNKISQQLTVLNNLLTSDPDYFDDYDIASLLIGANDFAQNTTLGTRTSVTGSSNFAGYLKDFIETLLWSAPTIKFFIMTPPEADGAGVPYNGTNTAGWTMKELSVLINQICTDYSIQCIDLYAYSGFNLQTIDTYTSDGLHPNSAGSDQLGEIIARAFEGKNNGQTMQDSGSTISYTDKAVLHGNSGALGQDATNFGWDYTNKILNIGSPSTSSWYGLEFKGSHVEAYIKNYASTATLKFASGRSTGWGGNIKFFTDEAERASISSTGVFKVNGLAGYGNVPACLNNNGEFVSCNLGMTNGVALWYNSSTLSYSSAFTFDPSNTYMGITGSNKMLAAFGGRANTLSPWFSFNDQYGYINWNWFSKYDGSNWVKTTGVGEGWPSRFRSQNGTFYFSNATADGALGSTITWQDILSLSNTGMTALSLAGTGSALTKVDANGLFSRATANSDYDASNTNEIQNLSYTASTRVLAIDGTGSTDATLPLFTSTDAGLVPLSGGGTTNFLRADGTWAAAGGGSGTVTSVTAGDGLTNTGTSTDPIINVVSAAGTAGSVGTLTITADAVGVALGTTNTKAYRGDLGNTAYNDRLKWDGGATGLTPATGRTSLGATTIGGNMFMLTNPSAITFPRFNADNTVSALSATDFRTAIGAGTGNGTVTSVSAGNGMNFTTITGTGSVTLGTPTTLTDVTSNTVSGTTHAHAITTYSPTLTWSSSTQPIALTSNGKTLAGALTINVDTISAKGMATQYDLTSKATRLGVIDTTIAGMSKSWVNTTYNSSGVRVGKGTIYSITNDGGISVTTAPSTNGGTVLLSNSGVKSINGMTGNLSLSTGIGKMETAKTVTTSGDTLDFETVANINGYVSTVGTWTGTNMISQDYFKILSGGAGYYQVTFSCNVKRTTANNQSTVFSIYKNGSIAYPTVQTDMYNDERKWVSQSTILELAPNDKIFVKCDPPSYSVEVDQFSITIQNIR